MSPNKKVPFSLTLQNSTSRALPEQMRIDKVLSLPYTVEIAVIQQVRDPFVNR